MPSGCSSSAGNQQEVVTMTGYYIKQTVSICIGILVGIWLVNNPDKWANGPTQPATFRDYFIFCGLGGGIGALVAEFQSLVSTNHEGVSDGDDRHDFRPQSRRNEAP
jgi:hypothetical protein